MKKIILLVTCTLTVLTTISLDAQLKVNSSGEVRFSKNVTILSLTAGNGVMAIDWAGNYYGENGTFKYSINTGTLSLTNGKDIKLLPKGNDPGDVSFLESDGSEAARIFAFPGSNFYIRGDHGGYGGIRMSLSTENVGIKSNPSSSYEFYVNGDAFATSGWVSSDKRIKDSVEIMDSEFVDKLLKLNGVAYKLKSNDYIKKSRAINPVSKENDTLYNDLSLTRYNSEYFSRKRFGLIAQEVEDIYPELVKEDESGFLAVNYDGFIPVIIEKLKMQQQTIDSYNNEIKIYSDRITELEEALINLQSTCCNNHKKGSLKNTSVPDTEFGKSMAVLYQNIPNPFNIITEIEYYLPESAVNASIFIYNMNGQQLRSYDLYQKGDGSIVINGNELNAGMYIYALIVDGQIIGTKQMILTDKK